MRLSDFLDDVGRPLAYYPALALCLGSVNATILLCQLFYWEGKQADEVEGWIYKTQGEITEETGLSRRESDTARKVLRKKQIVADRLRGVPPKIHFRINRKELNDLWDSWLKAPNQNGGKRQIDLAGSAKSDGGKRQDGLAESDESKSADAPNQNGASRHDKDSETTSETTSEITPETTRDHTHTDEPPSKGATPTTRKGVGVTSRYTLKERKRWARYKASLPGSAIRDYEAVARARKDGQDDEEIEEFLLLEERLLQEAVLPLFESGDGSPSPWPELPPPGEREEAAAAAWRDMVERLHGRLGAASLSTWIAPLTPVRISDGVLLLHAPNAVVRDWVGENYQAVLDAALAESPDANGVREIAFMRPESEEKGTAE